MEVKPMLRKLMSFVAIATFNIVTVLSGSQFGLTAAVAQTDSGNPDSFSPSMTVFANHILNHGASVIWITIAPDGNTVASAGADNNIKLWNIKTGELLRTLVGHELPVWTISYSADGKFLASVGQESVIRVWESATGKQIRVLRGHEDQVQGIVFSPNGKHLLSGSADKTARLWDVNTGKEIFKISNLGDVTWTYFSADGKMLITFASDGTIGLWDATTAKNIRNIKTLKEPGYGSTILPLADGKTIVTAEKNFLHFWDITTGKELRTFTTTHTDFIYSVAFSPNGKYIATASGDRTIKLIEAASGKEISVAKGHSDQVWYVAFTPDNKRLLSGSFDGTIRIWNIPLWERFLGISS